MRTPFTTATATTVKRAMHTTYTTTKSQTNAVGEAVMAAGYLSWQLMQTRLGCAALAAYFITLCSVVSACQYQENNNRSLKEENRKLFAMKSSQDEMIKEAKRSADTATKNATAKHQQAMSALKRQITAEDDRYTAQEAGFVDTTRKESEVCTKAIRTASAQKNPASAEKVLKDALVTLNRSEGDFTLQQMKTEQRHHAMQSSWLGFAYYKLKEHPIETIGAVILATYFSFSPDQLAGATRNTIVTGVTCFGDKVRQTAQHAKEKGSKNSNTPSM